MQIVLRITVFYIMLPVVDSIGQVPVSQSTPLHIEQNYTVKGKLSCHCLNSGAN